MKNGVAAYPVDLRQIDAEQLKHPCAEVELGFSALERGAAFGRRRQVSRLADAVERSRVGVDSAVAFANLTLREIMQLDCLLESKQMFLAPVSDQALDDRLLRGFASVVTVFAEDLRISLTGQDGRRTRSRVPR